MLRLTRRATEAEASLRIFALKVVGWKMSLPAGDSPHECAESEEDEEGATWQADTWQLTCGELQDLLLLGVQDPEPEVQLAAQARPAPPAETRLGAAHPRTLLTLDANALRACHGRMRKTTPSGHSLPKKANHSVSVPGFAYPALRGGKERHRATWRRGREPVPGRRARVSGYRNRAIRCLLHRPLARASCA